MGHGPTRPPVPDDSSLAVHASAGTANEGETEGDVTFTIDNPTVYAVMNAVRYARAA